MSEAMLSSLPLSPGSAAVASTALDASLELSPEGLRARLQAWRDACPFPEPEPQKLKEYHDGLHKDLRDARAAVADLRKRETELVNRLTQKEKEIYALETAVKHLQDENEEKARRTRATFMDPLINENFKFLQSEVSSLEKKLQTALEDLAAQTFGPNTLTGRQLITKCRRLQEENEEFGRQLSQGKLQEMEHKLALQAQLSDELTVAMSEDNEYLLQLFQERDEMQDKLFKMQDELRTLRAGRHGVGAGADGGGGGDSSKAAPSTSGSAVGLGLGGSLAMSIEHDDHDQPRDREAEQEQEHEQEGEHEDRDHAVDDGDGERDIATDRTAPSPSAPMEE